MARKKELKIWLQDLPCSHQILEVLQKSPLFSGYDIDSAIILVKGYSPPSIIKDVDKAIRQLERYSIINQHLILTYKGSQIINRSRLAKMLGISRPTLNKWINNKFITPTIIVEIGIESFLVKDVLAQLNTYKMNHK